MGLFFLEPVGILLPISKLGKCKKKNEGKKTFANRVCEKILIMIFEDWEKLNQTKT